MTTEQVNIYRIAFSPHNKPAYNGNSQLAEVATVIASSPDEARASLREYLLGDGLDHLMFVPKADREKVFAGMVIRSEQPFTPTVAYIGSRGRWYTQNWK